MPKAAMFTLKLEAELRDQFMAEAPCSLLPEYAPRSRYQPQWLPPMISPTPGGQHLHRRRRAAVVRIGA